MKQNVFNEDITIFLSKNVTPGAHLGLIRHPSKDSAHYQSHSGHTV